MSQVLIFEKESHSGKHETGRLCTGKTIPKNPRAISIIDFSG